MSDEDRRRVAEIDIQLDKLPTAANPEDQRVLDALRHAAEELLPKS